ncbi:hypothetical protein [Hymenobacter sp. BRD67]|uniref:hypothetical protein n=1 Tax=Hymenobacter sp. BRD67 TaxID=2675877 RepID=UPI0015676984|nr:hypothetical protein [Hymenobacter sp. BRD67]QKG52236.1 hypothetical protein GKZ67_05930 [Hymenobacter sp. BRD67]
MQPIPETSPRFSNLQLELLRLYSRDLPEADLVEIKHLLARYFAEKLTRRADQVWKEKGWTDDTMEEFLRTKMRSSSPPQPQ